jgi:hypothetical protein
MVIYIIHTMHNSFVDWLSEHCRAPTESHNWTENKDTIPSLTYISVACNLVLMVCSLFTLNDDFVNSCDDLLRMVLCTLIIIEAFLYIIHQIEHNNILQFPLICCVFIQKISMYCEISLLVHSARVNSDYSGPQLFSCSWYFSTMTFCHSFI